MIGLYLHHAYVNISLASTIYYMGFFILGIIIFKYKEFLKKHIGPKILFFGLIIYFSRFSFFGLYTSEALRNFFAGFGGFVLIYHAIYYLPFSNFLDNKVFVFLGKISYPLYLTHYPLFLILKYISAVNYNLFTSLQIVVLSIFATVFLSSFLSNYVEISFIKFSKHLFRSFAIKKS